MSISKDRAGLVLPGTIVPPLTPFGDDLRVDFNALKDMVDYVIDDCNASMVVAAGVEAQEYQYLDLDERKELIRRTLEFVDGRRPVVVGISHPSFRVAIELGEMAHRLGASAVQMLAPLRPFGGAPTLGDVVGYFEAVLREIKLPMMLYLNAGPGADLSIPATVELSKLDGIDYVKESSRDLARVSQLIVEIEHAGHAKYFTTMQMLLATLSLGGTGVTLPPPAAQIANVLIKAYVAGDFDEAARLQAQFAVFPARWMSYGLAPVMKAALNHLGIPAGLPYPPFKPVAGEDLKRLQDYIATTDMKKKRVEINAGD